MAWMISSPSPTETSARTASPSKIPWTQVCMRFSAPPLPPSFRAESLGDGARDS